MNFGPVSGPDDIKVGAKIDWRYSHFLGTGRTIIVKEGTYLGKSRSSDRARVKLKGNKHPSTVNYSDLRQYFDKPEPKAGE